MFSLVSIFSASAARKKMPPAELPRTRMRFGPIRFWIMADHLRSATVSAAPFVITIPTMRMTTLAMAAPYVGGTPWLVANASTAATAKYTALDSSAIAMGTEIANRTIPRNRRTPTLLSRDVDEFEPRVAGHALGDALAVTGQPPVHRARRDGYEPAPEPGREKAVPGEPRQRVSEPVPELLPDVARALEPPRQAERLADLRRELPVRARRAAGPVGELEPLRSAVEVDERAVHLAVRGRREEDGGLPGEPAVVVRLTDEGAELAHARRRRGVGDLSADRPDRPHAAGGQALGEVGIGPDEQPERLRDELQPLAVGVLVRPLEEIVLPSFGPAARVDLGELEPLGGDQRRHEQVFHRGDRREDRRQRAPGGVIPERGRPGGHGGRV